MKKYIFFVDSGAWANEIGDLPVKILPMIINVTDDNQSTHSYLCDIELKRNQLEDFLNQKKKVSTGQPLIGHTMKLIDECLTEYEKIIFVPISQKLSGHYHSLLQLYSEYDKQRLLILDTNAVSIDGRWIVTELIEAIENKKVDLTSDSLNKFVNDHSSRRCGAVIVEDVQQLINGGRLKGFKGLIAKSLKLKLVIRFNGALEFANKDLRLIKAVDKALDDINCHINYKKYGIKRICVMNDLKNQQEGIKLIHHIKAVLNQELSIETALLPDSVIAHAGTNTFSIMIERKESKC